MTKKSISSETPLPYSPSSSSAMSQSTAKSPAFLQRPSNLSLKHQQHQSNNFANSTSSPKQLTLMHNIAMNILSASSNSSHSNAIYNASNLNLLMTPTLPLNTPTLYAITPIDSFNMFNNCNTPVIQNPREFLQNQSMSNYIPPPSQSNKTNNTDSNLKV